MINWTTDGWDITDEKFQEFVDKVYSLRDEMFSRDVDGDSPITIIIANNTTHWLPRIRPTRNPSLNYDDIKYQSDCLDDSRLNTKICKDAEDYHFKLLTVAIKKGLSP